MKTLILTRAALAAFVLAGCATASRATTSGYEGPSSDYALWDTFSAASFTGAAPAPGATSFTATLDVASSGMVLGGGDRLYDGGAVATFTINGTASAAIDTLTLQLKYTAPAVGAVEDFFTVDASFGTTPGAYVLGTSVEGSNTFNIVSWTWTGLDLEAGGTFSVEITGQADGHVSLDGLRVDPVAVSAVPEPATYAAIFGGLVLAGAMLRRRFAGRSSC